jgi:hypothetical protein
VFIVTIATYPNPKSSQIFFYNLPVTPVNPKFVEREKAEYEAVLRIRILLDLDPEPLVRGTYPDPSIIKQK